MSDTWKVFDKCLLTFFFFKIYLFILCMWVHCSCTDGCWAFMWLLGIEIFVLGPLLTLVNSFQSHLLSPWSLWPKDLFILIHKYTVAVFRRTRRGYQISLRVVVSHHVVAGIWTQDLRKSSQCSYPLSHLTSPFLFIFKTDSHYIALTDLELTM
jgi:hypothetical protein